MPPPDETTPLVPVARPLNWRRKCCKFFHWSRYFVYFLLLLVDLVGRIMFVVVNLIVKYDNRDVLLYLVGPIVFNFLDALICWIFLGIVTRSPRFVGYFTVLKNLICLPKFWTLISVLVLYMLGVAITLWQFFSRASQNQEAKMKAVAVMGIVMEFLNVLTKVTLVGVLNYVQVGNVARSRFKYRLLKGSLVVIWLFQMHTLIGTMLIVFLSFILPIVTGEQVGSYDPIKLIQFFSLPIITRTAELIFKKILRDNKCIIGKNENNVSDESNESSSFTRQPNPGVSNAIDRII